MGGDVLQMYFPHEEAARLAGISVWRLRHWIRRETFVPERASTPGEVPHLLTFRDLVSLRVLAMLRAKRVPVSELAAVGRELRQRVAQPWSTQRFWILGREVYWKDPKVGKVVHPVHGQTAFEKVLVKPIATQLEKSVERSRARKAGDVGKIHPGQRGIASGQPCIRGTRLPTATIARWAAAGHSPEAIAAEYPDITLEDVRAALRFEERRAKSGKRRAA